MRVFLYLYAYGYLFIYLFISNIDYTFYSCRSLQRNWALCVLYEENTYQLECKSQLLNFLIWNLHNIWQLSFQPLIPVLKPVGIYFSGTLTQEKAKLVSRTQKCLRVCTDREPSHFEEQKVFFKKFWPVSTCLEWPWQVDSQSPLLPLPQAGRELAFQRHPGTHKTPHNVIPAALQILLHISHHIVILIDKHSINSFTDWPG